MKLKLILMCLFAILLIGIAHAEKGIDEPQLQLEIDVKVDGKKAGSNLIDGDDITKDAEPESNIKLTFEFTNLYEKDIDGDFDIEDIEITVTLEAIDDEGDDDIELEASINRIRPGRDSKKTFNFEIPLIVEEGDYTFQIDVEFDDEKSNATIDTLTQSLILTVEKDKHMLVINKAELTRNDLSNFRQTKLNLKILNLGQEDEEEVRITAFNSDLGLDFVDWDNGDIEIFSGIDEDSEYTRSIAVNAEDVQPGIYPITITVYRDEDRLEDTMIVDLTVLERVIEEEEEPEAVCGNLIVETGEACDDGNLFNEDGCSSACQTEQIVVQPPVTFEEEELTFWDNYGIYVLGGSTVLLFVVFIVILIVVFSATKRKDY